MKTMKIEGNYCRLEIGSILEGGFQAYLKTFENQKIVILVDENTHDYCLEYLITSFPELERAEIMLLPCGEENKVMEVCFQVWNALSDYRVGRRDLIINLGGGLVTDMGGFLASIYKRGIDFIHVPTSLLGMVDASLGGKNGIDLGPFKNQLGTFTDAVKIYIDPIFLKTLPVAELWNGYAEMLKHALIADSQLWKELSGISNVDDLMKLDLIKRSVDIKMGIVEQDPNEKGIRKLLNFGHTIGHAIEGYCLEKEQPIAHGHAVAIGLLLESKLSNNRGLLSNSEMEEIEKQIRKYFPLITIESNEEIDELLSIMYNDKKNYEGKIHGVLIRSIGVCDFDNEFDELEIKKVLNLLRDN